MDILAVVDQGLGLSYKGKPIYRFPEVDEYIKNIIMDKYSVYLISESSLYLCEILNDVLMREETKGTVYIITETPDDIEKPTEYNYLRFVTCTLDEFLHNFRKSYNDNYDDADTRSTILALGGESLFNSIIPYCKKINIASIESIKESDEKFPEISEDVFCKIDETRGDNCVRVGTGYSFYKYINKHIKQIGDDSNGYVSDN